MTQAPDTTLTGDEAAVRHIGDCIARSRYEAWDPHAQGPNPVPWEEFRGRYSATAENIYVEDGRRDARALLPLVQLLVNAGAVNALREAAHELHFADHLQAATLVLEQADRIDWTIDRED